MKSFLKGSLKAIFVIALVCIIGFVIIAVVVLRAPNKAINKLEDKITELEEYKEEITEIMPEEIQEQEIIEEEVEVQEEVNKDDIRPEFKKSMEDYEAFFDEYVNIVNSYMKEPTNLSLLSKYTDMLGKYEKYMSDFESIDESQLTDAECKLFLDTQLRISKKLTETAIDLS